MSKSVTKENTAPLVTAYARHLHIAPRKMRLVTNAVKNMPALKALAQLAHMNKKGAPMVIKLLNSAIANAKNNFSLDPETLYIKSITTDMGTAMKRYFPRARGSAFIIRRKLSHVNVILESRGGKISKKGTMKLKESAKKDEKASHAEAVESTAELAQKEEPKKTRTIKTSEQKKMNTVQQKRRLFNRKAGV
jgi:large subunit ribosomal protein L22